LQALAQKMGQSNIKFNKNGRKKKIKLKIYDGLDGNNQMSWQS